MKVDVLALGMLTCIRKAFELMRAHQRRATSTLRRVPREDPAVYDMLCKADAVGVFQVESRAQMNMLPRLRPAEFYDLVIEVAIVRPGPIQGDMVHPYLRRRSGHGDCVEYPSPAPEHGPPDELQTCWARRSGVPLFQEQAMKLAIVAAKFTPDEANGLRRAMATFRNLGTIDSFARRSSSGMVRAAMSAISPNAASSRSKGFGAYGFPESHAASFAHARLCLGMDQTPSSGRLRRALLNAQPMGFYAPARNRARCARP